MTSDLDLLRQFARENSQDAFAEIVRRHLNLIYSAALRQVRSPQLAEEISQSVFADLARNAGKLKSDTIVTAWLYSVTRRTAIDVIRKESRRQLREQIAAEMQNMNATANDWTQIEPLLDDAMAALDETDRAAILLRYFENKNLREVGESLNISDDAAQKRVSRAVERLREFFSKQKITIGASGLAVLISANAVQSAPIGLAATISTGAAISAVHSATTIGLTKTLAMTTIQKTVIATAFVAVIGTGVFEARQNSKLQNQIQTLQQQQAPLAEQIRQLQRERDDATNQLAGVLAENARLKSNPNSNETELLKLRGEVAQLRNAEAQNGSSDSTESMAKSWSDKVGSLKQYVQQNPKEQIPEIQFTDQRDWLASIDPTASYWPLQTTNDFQMAAHQLRSQAEARFGGIVEVALRKFSEANNGQFPTDLSQLQPYCDSNVEDILLQLYEIAPASIVKDTHVDGDWIIKRKMNANPNTSSYIAIYATGYTYFHP